MKLYYTSQSTSSPLGKSGTSDVTLCGCEFQGTLAKGVELEPAKPLAPRALLSSADPRSYYVPLSFTSFDWSMTNPMTLLKLQARDNQPLAC